MPARRIIFVNRYFHPDDSATSRLVSDVAFHLAAAGHSVAVITTQGRYRDCDSMLPARETIERVDVHRTYRPRFGRSKTLLLRALDYLATYIAFVGMAGRLSKPGDVVVVMTDPPLLSVALTPLALIRRLRLINWLQDLYPEIALQLGIRALVPMAPLLIAARNLSLRAAATNLVISEKMHERVRLLGAKPARIELRANWCDDESLTPLNASENPLRATWGLQNAFVIGYSGNLGRAHEFQTLVEAAGLLCDDRIRFLFIGGGHLTDALKAEIARLALEQYFIFRPFQNAAALSQSLSAADIHWLSMPAAMEGLILPSKLYGVAAVARPLIAVAEPAGEIGALLARYDCGVAIAPGDAHGFANAVRAYLNDPLLVKRHGENARRMLEENFSRRDALDSWERLVARR